MYITKIISLTFLTLILFIGCGKYEEGPNFSLRTKKKRLASHWVLQYKFTNNYAENHDVQLIIHDNGNFSYGYSLLDGFLVSPPQYDFHADSLGKWELLNNKEVLRFRHYNIESNDTYKLVDWTILKLKTTHLTLFREHNGNTIRLEFYRRGRSDHFKRIRTN